MIILKFFKFCLVGFSGMVLDFATTYLLKEKAKINKYVANSTGFMLAASSNYAWNRWWTFQSTNQHFLAEYFSFILIALAGLAINNLVVYLLTDKAKRNFYLSKLIAVGVVTAWNFGLNYLITFR